MQTLINNEVVFFQNTRLQNNSYVIFNEQTAIIIDPSWNALPILEFLKYKKIKNVFVFLTHAHYDHIAQIDKIKSAYTDTTFYISKHESKYLKFKSENYVFKSPIEINSECIFEIDDVDTTINIDNILISTFYNPGHSKGSMSYIYKNLIFTGDFIFSNCIGRLDLESGSVDDMKKSLNKIKGYANDKLLICPGHSEIDLYENVKKKNVEMDEYSK